MKHKPELLSGRQLVNRIWDHENVCCYPSLIDPDGDAVVGVYEQFFVCEWPEHCVTTQHLGDATIHGPYESESEAMSCHDLAEAY